MSQFIGGQIRNKTPCVHLIIRVTCLAHSNNKRIKERNKSVSQLSAIPKMISKVKVMQMSKHLQKVRYNYTSHVEGICWLYIRISNKKREITNKKIVYSNIIKEQIFLAATYLPRYCSNCSQGHLRKHGSPQFCHKRTKSMDNDKQHRKPHKKLR